jgi:hypothetical protein
VGVEPYERSAEGHREHTDPLAIGVPVDPLEQSGAFRGSSRGRADRPLSVDIAGPRRISVALGGDARVERRAAVLGGYALAGRLEERDPGHARRLLAGSASTTRSGEGDDKKGRDDRVMLIHGQLS